MPEPSQNPPSPLRPESEAGQRRKPAIRTMKSDLEELFRTTKPSLIKIIGEELTQQPDEKKEKKPKTWQPYLPLAGGLGLAIIIIGGALWWFFTAQKPESKPSPKLIPPAPFFATETSRTISVKTGDKSEFLKLLEDSMREPEREGTIKRIIIKLRDGPQERFATLADFLDFYRLKPPEDLWRSVDPTLMVFIHATTGGPRFGLAVRVKELGRALSAMLLWEPTLLADLRPLLFDQEPDTVLALFEDRTYRNIDWRFLKLSQEKDLGIGYFIFPARNVLVITFSKESAEKIIDRLFSQ